MSRRNRKQRVGQCVYCGQMRPLTVDHIPPRNLFAKPRPQLITVPACEECNGSASMDDEYFRLMLTSSFGADKHPDARDVMGTALRGLGKPEKRGFRDAFLSRLRQVELNTPSGFYLGRANAYQVDG